MLNMQWLPQVQSLFQPSAIFIRLEASLLSTLCRDCQCRLIANHASDQEAGEEEESAEQRHNHSSQCPITNRHRIGCFRHIHAIDPAASKGTDDVSSVNAIRILVDDDAPIRATVRGTVAAVRRAGTPRLHIHGNRGGRDIHDNRSTGAACTV